MGNLFKKKDTEPIKKVKVKLSCVCNDYKCHCGCTGTNATSNKSGTIDAGVCGDLYYRMKYPVS